MVYTEKEAYDRVCPFSLNGPSQQYCYSSKCMAWRWVDQIGTSPQKGDPTRTGTCNLIKPKEELNI